MAANYYDSVLLGYQSAVMPAYNEAELREINTEVLAVGLQNQKYLMDVTQIESIKESTLRPVYGYQFVRKPSTNGTAMTAFNTGIQGASAQVPLTWVAFTEEFFTYKTTGYDNVMQFEAIFQNEMAQAQRNIRERLRQYIITNLFSNRTQYDPGNINNATWDGANNTYTLGTSTTMWANIASVMRQRYYGYSNYDMFVSSSLYPTYQYTIAQGVNNATNQQYQFNRTPVVPGVGGYFNNVWEDIMLGNTDIGVETPYSNYALVMPKNSFAFIPWMPKIYREGGGDFESYTGGYGVVGDDMFPDMQYMVHGWATQQDTSANNGYTQDVVMQWQIGIYVAFQTAVIETPANDSPIFGFAMVP